MLEGDNAHEPLWNTAIETEGHVDNTIVRRPKMKPNDLINNNRRVLQKSFGDESKINFIRVGFDTGSKNTFRTTILCPDHIDH